MYIRLTYECISKEINTCSMYVYTMYYYVYIPLIGDEVTTLDLIRFEACSDK